MNQLKNDSPNTNDIKAVFFDIDGTLLSFKTHKVPASTEEAIRILKERGIHVFVSTGRSYNDIGHIRYLDFDGFITYNGGYCITKEGEVLFKKCINPNDVKALLNYADNNPLSFSLMSEHGNFIHDVTPEIAGMYAHLNLPIPPLVDMSNTDTENVLQGNIFISSEEEAAFMAQVMPDSVASRWSPLFADVNPSGQSKQVGIEVFCKHYGIDVSQTMAFGDGGNDITMLKYVALGVAMGNANPEVKEIADYVTDDIDNDGILKALKHFGIID
ncbi:Cof-type HAD-IIB family hydrolase [Elizabethkingia anophelis]|uniref:Cof-type HAD-IIB family hydrolase n=1 Tax=Elizabethkingia anophelis TaxID=1117645 RepID=UPI00201224B1|nr:Cof-type HAD-IIB family hydrolase [Elizabethkingia anophelis]EJC8058626.1 Cof-type HAD-IIB family hydrolase [Elizabethkingia anophelis]MCL1640607.1 Cof-type HAD-IIB family hydrolase [Elizabethkingia anophelis]MCL1644975.1 Cof-type HAD-IIB family hydrolase [Elizabethkingia anophelis]MCT3817646.1 Cof-type HAD-IIB family hydrolase [Elizabethkingia anophelis]MCT3874885.1 Cof-type HAD-IIB family hydrolase [Elizabethkingia anophelis]